MTTRWGSLVVLVALALGCGAPASDLDSGPSAIDGGAVDGGTVDASPGDGGDASREVDGATDAGPVGPPPLSTLEGPARYRPFEIALLDVPTDSVTGPVEATLGGVAITVLPVAADLAGFVVPELAVGVHALVVPLLSITASVEVEAPLGDVEARTLADAERARARAQLEAIVASTDPELVDVLPGAMDGLARLDAAEASLAGLTGAERHVFDHVMANLSHDAVVTTLDFATCQAAFWSDFRAKARLVLRGLFGMGLGSLIAGGGITIPIATIIVGVSLGYTLSVVLDAIDAGVQMVRVCYEGSIDLVDGVEPIRFAPSVEQSFGVGVALRWLYEPARDLLRRLQGGAGRIAALPRRLFDRLAALRTDDHAIDMPDEASVELVDVTPTTVTGTVRADAAGRVSFSFQTTAPRGTEVAFTFSLSYRGTEGITPHHGLVTNHCGDGIRQTDEACDGADLGGLSCGAGVYAASAGFLSCTSSCTIDATECRGLDCDTDLDGTPDRACLAGETCLRSGDEGSPGTVIALRRNCYPSGSFECVGSVSNGVTSTLFVNVCTSSQVCLLSSTAPNSPSPAAWPNCVAPGSFVCDGDVGTPNDQGAVVCAPGEYCHPDGVGGDACYATMQRDCSYELSPSDVRRWSCDTSTTGCSWSAGPVCNCTGLPVSGCP